jgi:opacity protein-like surface antigen
MNNNYYLLGTKIMLSFLKNKLLIIAITLAPFSVFAEHTPYFKGIFGINKFKKIGNFNNSHQTSNFSPDIGIGGGAGYNFDDTFRGEVLISYTNLTFADCSRIDTFYDFHINTKKVTINSAMLNIYKDFFKIIDNVNIFAGIGMGVSQITEYVIWESLSPSRATPNKITFSQGVATRKVAYNFTHSVIAGLDFKVSDRINIEVTYQYKNHGVTASKRLARVNVDQKHYLAHSIYTGFRYNL